MAYGQGGGDGAFDRAHRQLLQQPDLQFTLPAFVQPKPPAWLEPLARILKALGPVLPYVVWPALALCVGLVLFVIGRELVGVRAGSIRLGHRLTGKEEAWRPAPDQARALLEEADRLAERGQFVEAAHLILLRSIEDIQARRPRAVAISLTSRDIADLAVLPPAARDTFVGIAQAVERSLFGGRPLDGEGFARCRRAYEAFADSQAWT